MGILAEPAGFVQALPLPKGFAVCELGDQWVTYTLPHRLAKEWYEAMGCGRYESIDANGRGSITYDLNRKWHGKGGEFDLVTDFGTTEHIFNQAEVWRTIHTMTKVGGFIAFDKPTQGYDDHGFFNVHETMLRDLAAANAWAVVNLERGKTTRGQLIRGVFRKTSATKFQAPQQGRYQRSLIV